MNKIAIAQIDTTAGDIKNNAVKIAEIITKSKQQKVDLLIFPEFALCGNPYGDIFNRHKSLINMQFSELDKLAKVSTDITVLVGFLNNKREDVYSDSTAVLKNGKIEKIIDNTNNNKIDINGKKYLIITGEIHKDTKPYTQDISAIIYCNNTPSRLGSLQKNHMLFSSLAKELNTDFIYINRAGYGGDLIFEGGSRIYNSSGEVILLSKFFEEDFVVTNDFATNAVDLPKEFSLTINNDRFDASYENDLERTYKATINAIKGYFDKNGFKRAVLGLSGGLDSTICATLLADALGENNVYGISMPSQLTSSESKSDAEILAKNLGINFLEIPVAEDVNKLKTSLNGIFDKLNCEKYEASTTIENLQARLRATILWSISNEFKQMLPIATSDKSELYIGYATVNGDMTGGFAPIADITKTKLFALGKYLNSINNRNVIPQTILEKPPCAELKVDKATNKIITAEEDNMPYLFLDEIIWEIERHSKGLEELKQHKFYFENQNPISQVQKEEWLNKFFRKMQFATYKWKLLPASVMSDYKSINSNEYNQPIISKIY